MTSPVIWREMWRLAWPVICEECWLLLIGAGLTALAGRYGAVELAAFGLAGTVFSSLQLLCTALGTGVASLMAREVGAARWQEARRLAGQGLWLSFLLAPLLWYAMAALPQQFTAARLKTVTYMASELLRVVALFAPCCLLGAVGRRVLQAVGRADMAFAINGLSQTVALLAACLAAQGRLLPPGVAGMVWGLGLGQATGALAVLASLGSCRGLSLRWGDVGGLRPAVLWRIVRVSMPVVLEQVALQGGFVVYTFLLAEVGAVQFAAHEIALQVEAVPLVLGSGLSVAALVLTGRYVGGGQIGAAVYSVRWLSRIGGAGMTALALAFWPVTGRAAALFSQDAAVVEWAALCIMLAVLEQPTMAAGMIWGSALRGAGDTRRPMYSAIAGMWLVRIPLGYLYISQWHYPITAAWFITAADHLVRSVLLRRALTCLNGRL